MNQCQILVADDDPNAVLMLKYAFEYKAPDVLVHYMADGKEVVDYLQGKPPFDRESLEPPCLLLLDLKMPRMDGFEVLKWVKEFPALRPKCVAVFSTSGDPGDREQAAALGADMYIVKPFEFATLCEMVGEFAMYSRSGWWPPDGSCRPELQPRA
ncbi:MAG TPA: response regulator [Clostridia bacterium]|nr:response regulator [Clostridia bacterium]